MRRSLMHESVLLRQGRILLVAAILALAFSSPLRAEDNKAEEKTEAPFQDKLMIRGGWA
jgi:hypothetical protein